MSESNVEQLLSELNLVKPSPELDGRVLNCLTPSPPVKANLATAVHGRPRTAAVSGVAAAALLMGCAIGFLVGNSAGVTPEENAAALIVASNGDSPLTPDKGPLSSDVIASEFQGPAVSITCALVSQSQSSELHSSECQDCHSGLSESQKSFRERHLNFSQFATCTLCHAADVSLNVMGMKKVF